MALSMYMHPRNLYKSKKPSFKDLYSKYPFFKNVSTKNEHGKVTLDFKQPKQLAAIARALLLEDFGLDVDIPLDRLIPTIPLRLNYILWLEDILACMTINDAVPLILDIGTGSSCIYPIIGAKKNGWNFIGAESDSRNFNHSVETIIANSLDKQIHMIRVNDNLSSPLAHVFEEFAKIKDIDVSTVKVEIVMANPPFYEDVVDAVGVQSTRSMSRVPAKSVSSAVRQESQTKGGEVGFAIRLAEDSLNFRNSIGVFTLMLGKKRSVPVVRRYLAKIGITNTSVYEMCQGRVMRWGIAWTFIPNFKFPVSEFRQKRRFQRPPLAYTLPEHTACLPSYTQKGLLEWLTDELKEMKMLVLMQKNKAALGGGYHIYVEAWEDTWTHSRRRRREQKREQAVNTTNASNTSNVSTGSIKLSNDVDRMKLQSPAISPPLSQPDVGQKRPHDLNEQDEKNLELASKRIRLQRLCKEGQAWMEELEQEHPLLLNADGSDVLLDHPSIANDGKPSILRANIYVESELHGFCDVDGVDEEEEEEDDDDKKIKSAIGGKTDRLILSIDWLGGDDRETANRVLCYLKNRLR